MNYSQKYGYTLTTKTPIHIGTGETITPLEYYITQERFVIPDVDILFVEKPEIAIKFVQDIAEKTPNKLATTPVHKLLSKDILDDSKFWKYATAKKETQKFYNFALEYLQKQSVEANVRCTIKSPKNAAYIPGSSIKGALRTAWAYKHFKSMTQNQLEEFLKESYKPGGDKEINKLINKVVFQPPNKSSFEVGYDLFKVLQVGDSNVQATEDVCCLTAARVLSVPIRADGQLQNSQNQPEIFKKSIFCEAIDWQKKFTGNLYFAEGLLKDSKARQLLKWTSEQEQLSMELLHKAVNDFSSDICDWELQFLEQVSKVDSSADSKSIKNVKKFYEELKAEIKTETSSPTGKMFFSLGYGSGWHKMTIGMILKRCLSKERFTKLREEVNLAKDRTAFVYPKSRKLVMLKEDVASRPFGWVELKYNT